MNLSSRQPNDFYPTPDLLALNICHQLSQIVRPAGIIEPSAGTGAFIRAAKKIWPHTPAVGVDIDPAMQGPIFAAGADDAIIDDWIEVARGGFVPDVLVLGNPPFSRAREHIEAGLAGLQMGDHLAMLLRMSFLGSRERVSFWQKHPLRYLQPLVPRPNFVKGKSDNSEYGVFIWEKDHTGPAHLLPALVWK